MVIMLCTGGHPEFEPLRDNNYNHKYFTCIDGVLWSNIVRATLTTGQTGHVPRGPKLLGAPNFLVDCEIA